MVPAPHLSIEDDYESDDDLEDARSDEVKMHTGSVWGQMMMCVNRCFLLVTLLRVIRRITH